MYLSSELQNSKASFWKSLCVGKEVFWIARLGFRSDVSLYGVQVASSSIVLFSERLPEGLRYMLGYRVKVLRICFQRDVTRQNE